WVGTRGVRSWSYVALITARLAVVHCVTLATERAVSKTAVASIEGRVSVRRDKNDGVGGTGWDRTPKSVVLMILKFSVRRCTATGSNGPGLSFASIKATAESFEGTARLVVNGE